MGIDIKTIEFYSDRALKGIPQNSPKDSGLEVI